MGDGVALGHSDPIMNNNVNPVGMGLNFIHNLVNYTMPLFPRDFAGNVELNNGMFEVKPLVLIGHTAYPIVITLHSCWQQAMDDDYSIYYSIYSVVWELLFN